MCYWENVVENIEEKRNAFTKKMDKVGELADRKRVMVFADDDNAIDTKTHFEYITHKIDLSAEGFIKAVEEAIAMKIAETEGIDTKKTTKKKSTKKSEPTPVIEDEETDDLMEQLKATMEKAEEDTIDEGEILTDEMPFDEEDVIVEDEIIALDTTRLTAIRTAYKAADANIKTEVKKYLVGYGNKLSDTMKSSDVNAIEKILGFGDEV